MQDAINKELVQKNLIIIVIINIFRKCNLNITTLAAFIALSKKI